MAKLHSSRRALTVTLTPRAAIGRLPSCEITLDNPRVSSRHAAIRWTAGGWEIKDLGSRNGTLLDTLPLSPDAWRPLKAGAGLIFGEADEAWRLVDDAPPALPMARALDTGDLQEGLGEMLLLPDTDDPVACVRQGASGWVQEDDGDTRPVADDAVVTVGGRAWRLYLPSSVAPTVEGCEQSLTLASAALHFAVSLDEENVHITATSCGRELDLGSRVHHYLLLLLARQRLADRDEGVPRAEEGWLYRDDLLRMLATDRTRLNMEIFRARRQLAAAGFVDAAGLVERRDTTRQLRLSVGELSVSRG
jgi:hypothetical protein